MKFLIAGLGSVGRRHLRNLLALGERDILLYRSHQSSLPEDELDGFPVETDLMAALAHRPQAVIVSNPTALHLEVAIPAAEAGCHLLLEKPVSHSLDGLDNLAAALTRGGGRLLVGFQFRFHPGLRLVARLLASDAIGRPVSVRAHWGEYLPGWHPWEDYRMTYSARRALGGGAVLTLSHPFDYLRWLLGEVSALWAFAGHLSDLELDVEDTAEIGLQFASALVGSLHLDFNQRPSCHHLEIVGTLGTIRWDNADGRVSVYRAIPWEDGRESGWEYFPAPDGFERNSMFLEEMKHFVAVARQETEPVCTLNDGQRALELALAALASARGAQIVEIR